MFSPPHFRSVIAAIVVTVLIGSSGPANSFPLAQGTAAISGRVSPCVKLSLGQAGIQLAHSDVMVNARSVSPDTMQVVLSGAIPRTSAQFSLPLEIRTNVGYELRIVLLSSEGCAPDITTSVGSIRASGALVSRSAESARNYGPLELSRSVSPTTTLKGSRVSLGGNFSTSANALLVDLISSIPATDQQCYWRVTFQVSLHPSN